MDSTSSPRAVYIVNLPARPELVEGFEWGSCSS